MLKYRLIFGPLMIVALLALFYFDQQLRLTSVPSGLLIWLAFLVVIVLGSRELCHIFRAKGIDADPLLIAAAPVVGCTLMYALPDDLAVYTSSIVTLFVLSLIKYTCRKHRIDGAITAAAVTLLAMVYLGTLPGFYLLIRHENPAWLIVAIVMVCKSCDIGAYFIGRAMGKHKLIAWLSPGKTWEGFVGGILFSSLVAIAIAAITNCAQLTSYSLIYIALCGLLIGAFGQFGDLIASLFKRDAGLKDSAITIPGFGGVLDVIDSPLIVAPLAYWLVEMA